MPLLGSLANSHVSFEIITPEDWVIFQEIFVDRCYAPAVDLWLSRGSYKSTHLDLGSNRGYFSTYLAHRLLEAGLWDFKIYGVDASQENVTESLVRLERQLTVKLQDKVQYRQGLVGLREGEALFSTSKETYMNRIVQGYGRYENPVEPAVKVSYLDLNTLNLGPIGLLKCDIEGAEEQFLETYQGTLLLREVQVAVFEFHHSVVNVARCRQILRSVGLMQQHVVQKGGTSVEVFSR